MHVIHSPLHARHDGGVELHRGELVPCFEAPARVEYILQSLRGDGFALVEPATIRDDALESVHDAGYLAFLHGAHARWREAGNSGSMLPSGFPARGLRQDRVPHGINGAMGYYAFDAGTPIMEGTWEAAVAAAACALDAAGRVAQGERAVYALCRPPGHHAARSVYGGYCFLNNAALAAQRLRERGASRVAIIDVDYHHGNGTQEIFWDRDDVLFVSLHGTPDTEYPYFLGYEDERGVGAGEGFNLNLPLPAGTDWEGYDAALGEALRTIRAYGADALVVSLGVDTYEGDPISSFRLAAAHFTLLGERLAGLGMPTVLVQEGGYAVEEIGSNVARVLHAFT